MCKIANVNYGVKVGAMFFVKWINKTDVRMSSLEENAQLFEDKDIARQTANKICGDVVKIITSRIEPLLVEERLTIKKDDILEIHTNGTKVRVQVISANNYGKEDGWYIESMIMLSGVYSYWKQGQDGGHIVSLNGKEVS